ncbi:30S ribosomal protein S18 [Kitasatospora cineracea]|uniref:30S ribosomal protein S18 n=1 Tax=Kitasatospora cineracea TaxID=88074 RepID=UPI0036DE8989
MIEAGIEYIDHKDTTRLRKFVSDRGKILPRPPAGRCPLRRVTRLTVQQQRAMAATIKNARETALLPYATTVR